MNKVWKFGTRWDDYGRAGTSIFRDVFCKYSVAFTYTEACMQMREGDLIAFADGYDIVAIGQATTPPAAMPKFHFSCDPEDRKYYFDNPTCFGCRVQIFHLNDDGFCYKKRGKFSGAPAISEKVNSLFEKYSGRGLASANNDHNIPELNIFHWANKELAQDSFLCWLLSWSASRCKSVSSSMHTLGRRFLELLLARHGVFLSPNSVIDIRPFKQFNSIDLVARVRVDEAAYALLIEDKVCARVYNDLESYFNRISTAPEFAGCKVLPFLIRTGDEADVGNNQAFQVFLRKDFIALFEEMSRSLPNHEVVRYFYEHLKSVDANIESYTQLPIRAWHPDSWKGFYSFVTGLDGMPFDEWNYVANANGGFLCLFMSKQFQLQGFPVYWQIESDKKAICLKVGEVYENHSAVRDAIIAVIDRYLLSQRESGTIIPAIVPPGKKGCGCCMTLKLIPQKEWLGNNDEILDVNHVEANLRKAVDFLGKMVQYTKDRGDFVCGKA